MDESFGSSQSDWPHLPERRRPDRVVRGVEVFSGYLGDAGQQALLADLRGVVAAAPLFAPETRWGRPMSVRMTSAGKHGWFSDRRGYRYVSAHPRGTAWPAIPQNILAIWRAVTGLARDPDCCLVNFYGEGARMGMHQDRDEASFDWPVLSVSLGDDARFRVGNLARGGATESLILRSGDVLVMGGAARLLHHGIDRIDFGSSGLIAGGGRVNLTLRVVE